MAASVISSNQCHLLLRYSRKPLGDLYVQSGSPEQFNLGFAISLSLTRYRCDEIPHSLVRNRKEANNPGFLPRVLGKSRF